MPSPSSPMHVSLQSLLAIEALATSQGQSAATTNALWPMRFARSYSSILRLSKGESSSAMTSVPWFPRAMRAGFEL